MRFWWFLLIFGLVLIVLGIGPVLPYLLGKGEFRNVTSSSVAQVGFLATKLRVVYFDSLFLDVPNDKLLFLARRLGSVHDVSIYVGGNATVESLLSLLKRGDFDVLIVRAHMAPMSSGSPFERGVAVFGERAVREDYFVEQVSGFVRRARPLWGGGVYYAVTPLAFEGLNYSGKIVVLLGCSGFDDYMPGVVAGGGGVYASWDGFVSPEANDAVAEAVLSNLLAGRHPLYGVVGYRDPTYGSRFLAAAPRGKT
jgi:hypothetical protein